MPNKWCLDHDGTTLRVYSDMVLLLEVPLAELDAAPAVFVGRDPATGKLAFCPPPAAVAGPPGPAGAAGADGGAPTTAERQCGAARRTALQLIVAYNWLRDQIISSMAAWLANNAHLDNIISSLAGLLPIPIPVGETGTLLFSPVSVVSNLVGMWADADYNHAVAQMAPFTPGQADAIAQSVYCAFALTGAWSVTDNMEQIQRNLARYPNWIDPTQYYLLNWALTYLSDQWQTWADQGAADGSKSCSGFTCAWCPPLE